MPEPTWLGDGDQAMEYAAMSARRTDADSGKVAHTYPALIAARTAAVPPIDSGRE